MNDKHISKNIMKKSLNVQNMINCFVLDFFKETQTCDNISEKWKDEKLQNQIKGIIKYNTRYEKKIKKKKDPNEPKRPRNCYIYFCKETRPVLKEQNIKGVEIFIKLGQEWRKTPIENKQPYLDLAAQDKLRYEKEKQVYLEEKEKSMSIEPTNEKELIEYSCSNLVNGTIKLSDTLKLLEKFEKEKENEKKIKIEIIE